MHMSTNQATFSITPKSAETTFKMAIAGDSTSQYLLAHDLDSDYCFRLTLDNTAFRCSVQTALYRINSNITFRSVLKQLFTLNPSNATYSTIFGNAIEHNDTDGFELCISAVHNPQTYLVARQSFLTLLDINSKHFNLNWFDLAAIQRVLDEDDAIIKKHSTSDDIILSSKRFSSSVISLFHRHAKFSEEIGHIGGKAAIDWSNIISFSIGVYCGLTVITYRYRSKPSTFVAGV